MSDFTQEELILLACWSVNRCFQVGDEQAEDEGTLALSHKIQDMIINYNKPMRVETIGTGQLLFHNKCGASSIVSKIYKQIDLCDNDDESKCFRIDWRIFYGKKFGK